LGTIAYRGSRIGDRGRSGTSVPGFAVRRTTWARARTSKRSCR